MAKEEFQISKAFTKNVDALGHKILYVTDLPRNPNLGKSKKYVWIRDENNRIYLEAVF